MSSIRTHIRHRSLIPELENGDHLSRDEFERRYHAMPEVKKGELIEGIVYLQTRVRRTQHSAPDAKMVGWLGCYSAFTPGAEGGDNGTVRLDLDNEPQPDSFLFINRERGGQAIIDEEGYIAGSPELVGEIAASSASYDLHTKLTVYRRNRVQEYVVWRVLDQEIDWFILRGSQYDKSTPDSAGIFRSVVFPGLWLDVPALMAGDMAKVIGVVQQGLATAQHEAFVQRLRAAVR